MTTRILPAVLGSTCLLFSPLAMAQQVAVPSHAPLAEGQQSSSLPFGKAGFHTQIVIDADAIAPNGALLSGLRLRADRASAPLAATSVPNVTVTLSHTSAAAGTMSDTFASNVTGVGTVVFQGTVQLPAAQPGFAGPMGWDVVVPFNQFTYDRTQGNLLIDIVGNNAAGQSANYYFDAEQAGGSATKFGDGPPLSNFDYPYLLATVAGGASPTMFSPGNTIDFICSTSFSSPPGVMALGTSALAAPVDLGPLGAPGNSAYVDPIAFPALSWQGSFIGWNGIASVVVPNLPALIGTVLYGQAVLVDPPANALNVVTTEALEVRIGDATAALPLQQLDAADPAAVSGTLLDFGWFGNPSYGAVPVLLEGVFF